MEKGVYNSYKSSINNIGVYVTGGFLLATFCSGIIAGSVRVSAEDPVSSTASANASVTVAEACTFAFNNIAPHTTTLTNNNTAENVGSTTFTATCNDPSGLAIYAVGYSNNEFGNTNLIGSSGNIATGTDDSSSNWSLKLNNLEGYTAPDFLQSSYTAVPATYAKVASRNSNTTSSTTFGVNATYRFHISATQPADTYTGKVKYTMVHPASEVPPQPQTTQSGKICYYPNGTAVVGTMGCQTIPTSGGTVVTVTSTSATLLASNFSRQGYGFAGWNTEYDYSGTFYGPNETISFTKGQYTGTNPGLSLYAVWVKSVGSLQDSSKVAELCGTGTGSLTTASIDGTANLSSVSALTDERDNDTYAIAKLADGKCWMIENLRLDNTAELTLANTNNPLNNGTNVTLKHNYTDTDTHNILSPTSSLAYNADTAPDGWCTSGSVTCDDQSRLRTDNTANRATGNPNVNTGSMYSYGNYYNWYSATAGNGTYSYSTNNNSVSGDLCPAGWRLPKGGDKTKIESNADNEFWNLAVVALNNNTLPANYSSSYNNPFYANTAEAGPVDKALRIYPNNYLYSGYVYEGSMYGRGTSSRYWSSTASSYSSTYQLTLDRTSVNPGSSAGARYTGDSVRCLAQTQ